MDKIRKMVIGLLMLGLLTACGKKEPTFTFTGTLLNIHGKSATVLADEDEAIRSSGSKVSVDLSVNEEATFEIGDRVKVTYNGEVGESSPLDIRTLAVEKLE